MSLAVRARVSWLMLSFSLFVCDVRSVASTVHSTESVCEAAGTEQAHTASRQSFQGTAQRLARTNSELFETD